MRLRAARDSPLISMQYVTMFGEKPAVTMPRKICLARWGCSACGAYRGTLVRARH